MFIIIVIVLLGFMLWPAYAAASRKRQSYELHKRVIDMGDVTRYDYAGVMRALGELNAVSGTVGNGKLVQWIAPRYHIVMSFAPNGQCLGIDSESAV